MVLPVVPGQHVPAEVAVEVSPDGVAVVVVVLGIVVFNQEGGGLHPVVVTGSRLDRTGPGKKELAREGFVLAF